MKRINCTQRAAARLKSTFPLQVRIDPNLQQRLREKSLSAGLPIRWLVEQALGEYLDALGREAR